MEQLHGLRLGRIKSFIVGLQQLDAGIQKEETENNQRHLECVDDGDPSKNKSNSHCQGTEDSPEENSVLIHLRNLKMRE